MAKAKKLFEIRGITRLFEQQQQQLQQEQREAQEQYDKEINLSQIELIYRAEGNANVVLALPQFKKVLRLPKVDVQQKTEQQQQRSQQKEQQQVNAKGHLNKLAGPKYQCQQQQQQPELTLSTDNPQSRKDGNQLTMEQFAAYIDVIRNLVGNEYVFEVDVVHLSNPNWLNTHFRQHRPVNRLDKEFSGRHGLLLPDVTQLPSKFDLLFFNLQSSAATSGDTYAIEIKPKQGWQLCDEFYDLFNKNVKFSSSLKNMVNKNCHYYQSTQNDGTPELQEHHQQYHILQMAKSSSILCRYCSMQFLKLQQQKIHQLSNYCPLKLFSGKPDKMLEALNALFKCPQNNLRIYRNCQLIYDDQLIKCNNIESIFTPDKVRLIKHLLIICLLRDYTEQYVTAPTGYDMNSLMTKTAKTIIMATTVGTTETSDVTSQTNLSVAAFSLELANSRTFLSIDELYTKQSQQRQQRQQQQQREREQQKTVCELALNAVKCTSLHSTRITTELAPRIQVTGTTLQTNNTSSSLNSIHNEITETLHLPINCVLQKILHLQLLAKKNLLYMFQRQYHQKCDKSYSHVQMLLEKFHANGGFLNFSQLKNEDEYLLGATALDCSIMITFREVVSSIENLSFPLSLRPYLIEMPELNQRFISKVTLLDLDAKPDNHFAKYCQQTENILNLFQ